MYRLTILTVLLVICYVSGQNFIQRTKRQSGTGGLKSGYQPERVDDAVNWVNQFLNTTQSNKPSGGFNLDPSNVVIRNSSLTRPVTPNKFDDEINSTFVEKPCVTEGGESGVCVVYYQCDPQTRKVIGDGTSLIDIRSGNVECVSYLDICCKLNDRLPVEPQKTEKQEKDAEQPQQAQNEAKPSKNPSVSKECGWNDPSLFVFQPPNQDVSDRGVYANYGEFPWMVALLRKSGTKVWVQNDYIGGGAIIHPSVVVTAFHKLLQVTPNELKCRAGEWDTQTDKEQYGIQERDADRFVSHEEYFRASVYNDIALIFLKAPFELTSAPHIGPACLARVMPDAATCFSMGWGKDVLTDEYVNILKKVKLPLVEHDRCRELLHTNTRFRHIPNFVLHESLTCAGGEELVDTCRGDGGSALVCPIGHRDGKTRYAVVGLVAYGLECGKRDVPGVYVNVPHLADWVDRQMRAEGLGTDSYSF
ncbi:phenoloxidase-activating factor 2 [Bicyclus anynana]|uniref:Phenoloxidase-activating factor 2 n=1 Tax=Bicyclus anynana TaxID=110368 RepID=A0ABM3M3A6_BICAN|nr:phenoloxidase-activating factor 2 [Bicyclus anynana]